MPRALSMLLISAAASLLLLAVPSARGAEPAPFGGGAKLADIALEQVRGGFELSSGLTLRFGIEMTASLNGLPLQQIQAALDPAKATPVDAATLNHGIVTVLRNARSNVSLSAVRTVNIDIQGVRDAVRHASGVTAMLRSTRLSAR
jgi:hypothetical protein